LHNRFSTGKNCGKCIAALEQLLTKHKNTIDERT
jgi:bacterioferritin-associated ferredoxin